MADTPMDFNLHHVVAHNSNTPITGNLQDIAEDIREAFNDQDHKRLPTIPKRNGNGVNKRSATPSSSSHKRSNRFKKPRTVQSPSISGPLSELTKDSAIPVRDIEAWVNRPASDRIRESALRDGHISRPMNSFMLYRSAYAERTKEWCKNNNHQVVSTVAGESWTREPQAVRDQFSDWARQDKENHAAAFPDYRFTPAKPRRQAEEYEDDSAVEIDDGQSEVEFTPSRKPARSEHRRASAALPRRRLPQPTGHEFIMDFEPEGIPAGRLPAHAPNLVASYGNHWVIHQENINNGPFRGMPLGFHYGPGTFLQSMQGYAPALPAPPMPPPSAAPRTLPPIVTRPPWLQPASSPQLASRTLWPQPGPSPHVSPATPWSPFAGFSPVLPPLSMSPFSSGFQIFFEDEAVRASPLPLRAPVAVVDGTIDPRLLMGGSSVEAVAEEEGAGQ